MTTDPRQRLRPWLEGMINSGEIPGLSWVDKERTKFRVSWKHAGKPDFNVDQDAVLFRKWAEHTGKYRSGESPDPSTWKTRFRCALHKMPDIEEVKVPRSLDGDNPYRVFQFKPRGTTNSSRESAGSPPAPISSPTPAPAKGYATPHHSLAFHGRPQVPSFLSGGVSAPSEGAFDLNDDSFDELDAIVPTFPEQISPPNSVDKYYGHTGYVEAQMRTVHGDVNTLFDNPFYSYRMQAQQALSTSWLKLLVTDSECSHVNGYLQQNGFSETLPSEMPMGLPRFPSQCEVDLDYTAGEYPYCKPYASTGAQESTMEIKIFYDKKEIDCLEITKQESDRSVRLSTASPEELKRRCKPLNYNDHYNAYYGPTNAKQVVLPIAETRTSNETRTVLENMTRGLILQMNDDGDVYASRLCLSRVFCTNGTEEATKLHRDGTIKVFDYQTVFLPKLLRSSSGNCCPPSYDITFNLGRADGSLVAIVVTHTHAKKKVDQIFGSVERFFSEPSPDDQMLDGEDMEP